MNEINVSNYCYARKLTKQLKNNTLSDTETARKCRFDYLGVFVFWLLENIFYTEIKF